MKGCRFSEEQIIGILREAEAGLKTAEVCRRHDTAEATLHKWKAKYGGTEVVDAKRLRGLEDENRRLKKPGLPGRGEPRDGPLQTDEGNPRRDAIVHEEDRIGSSAWMRSLSCCFLISRASVERPIKTVSYGDSIESVSKYGS
jgi:putative transposase